MALREVTYTDPQGRMWARLIPKDAPDSDAAMGIPLGPESLGPLKLPMSLEVRLHNELFARRIFSEQDARRGRSDIGSAIQHALRVDIGAIVDLYIIDAEGA